MVVDEKSLMKAMKEAYKGSGYKVAVEDDGGQIDIIISTALWTVVIEKSEFPRKVLGMIAEHIGEIPGAGYAYQVKKKETQVEIFDIVLKTVRDFHSGEKERRIVRRTNLTLGGYNLWQAASDQKIVRLDPLYEDIMIWGGNKVVRIIGDDLLMVDDLASRAYISCMPVDEKEQHIFDHLAKMEWPVV